MSPQYPLPAPVSPTSSTDLPPLLQTSDSSSSGHGYPAEDNPYHPARSSPATGSTSQAC